MKVKTMSLQEENYDVTESECPDCEHGSLWVNSYELVCDDCGMVFRKDQRQSIETRTPAEEFYENRDSHTYDNGNENMAAGKIRMPGGFPEAYPDRDPEEAEFVSQLYR